MKRTGKVKLQTNSIPIKDQIFDLESLHQSIVLNTIPNNPFDVSDDLIEGVALVIEHPVVLL